LNSHFTIESFGKSDIGLIRNNNEDVFRELPKEKFFILADGMGGHNAGEIAASRAVEYMCSGIQNFFINKKNSLELEDIETQIESVIENTNLWVHHLGASNPKFYGMGTTLCSILFFKEFIIYSHVGDSRIYRFRKGTLSLLTNDHTVYSKNLPTLENRNGVSLPRKVLAKAIGTSIFVSPEIKSEKVEVGDIYLLSSDGLHDLVSDATIESLLKNSSDLNQVASHLIETAKESGGHDNITLLLVKIHDLSGQQRNDLDSP
jgi:serine/threonine protein phosphatase PrpC